MNMHEVDAYRRDKDAEMRKGFADANGDYPGHHLTLKQKDSESNDEMTAPTDAYTAGQYKQSKKGYREA